MPDDQNLTPNPISTENSIPPSPKEPTEQVPENTAHSEPSDAPPEALESSPNDFSVKSNDIAPFNSTLTETENEPKTEEKQAQNEPSFEPVSEPIEAPKPKTAQIPVNEPLEETKISEPDSASSPQEESEKEEQEEKPKVLYLKSQKWNELLVMARNAIQFRKRKKLDRVMSLFLQQSKITNDEVEKFLHVSDATATRYLSQLEKEGKIKQNGKTGHMVSYSRI